MMAYESKNAGADRNLLLQRNDEKKMSVDNLSPLSTLTVVRWKGLEPPTFWFVAKHSIQLSYQRICIFNANVYYHLLTVLSTEKREYKCPVLFAFSPRED